MRRLAFALALAAVACGKPSEADNIPRVVVPRKELACGDWVPRGATTPDGCQLYELACSGGLFTDSSKRTVCPKAKP